MQRERSGERGKVLNLLALLVQKKLYNAKVLWRLQSYCIIPYPQSPTHCIVVYVYISRINMVGSVRFVLSEISGDN
jgi:hypothetical protein